MVPVPVIPSRAYGCGFCGIKAMTSPAAFAKHVCQHLSGKQCLNISNWAFPKELESLTKLELYLPAWRGFCATDPAGTSYFEDTPELAGRMARSLEYAHLDQETGLCSLSVVKECYQSAKSS